VQHRELAVLPYTERAAGSRARQYQACFSQVVVRFKLACCYSVASRYLCVSSCTRTALPLGWVGQGQVQGVAGRDKMREIRVWGCLPVYTREVAGIKPAAHVSYVSDSTEAIEGRVSVTVGHWYCVSGARSSSGR